MYIVIGYIVLNCRQTTKCFSFKVYAICESTFNKDKLNDLCSVLVCFTMCFCVTIYTFLAKT